MVRTPNSQARDDYSNKERWGRSVQPPAQCGVRKTVLEIAALEPESFGWFSAPSKPHYLLLLIRIYVCALECHAICTSAINAVFAVFYRNMNPYALEKKPRTSEGTLWKNRPRTPMKLFVAQGLLVAQRLVSLVIFFFDPSIRFVYNPALTLFPASLLRVDLAVCVAILILMWRQYTGRYHDADVWTTRLGYTLCCEVYLYLWYVLHIYMAWRVRKLRNTESEAERAIRRDVYLAVMEPLNTLTGALFQYDFYLAGKSREADVERQDPPKSGVESMDRNLIDHGVGPLGGCNIEVEPEKCERKL